MELNYAMQCCGVHEINCLSHYDTPKAAMQAFCKIIYPTEEANKKAWKDAVKRASDAGAHSWDARFTGGFRHCGIYEDVNQHSKFRFAIFTEAVDEEYLREGRTEQRFTYGRKFAAFIEKENLGSLVQTENHELNPNSGKKVMVFVWGIDHAALKTWYKKHLPKEEKLWAQKAMSDVIGNAGSAPSPSVAPPTGLGNTLGNAGNVPISNVGSTTLGSAVQNIGRAMGTRNR